MAALLGLMTLGFAYLGIHLIVSALLEPIRPKKRPTSNKDDSRGLSPIELDALRRRHKNDAIRQMRALARQHRTASSRHRDHREQQW